MIYRITAVIKDERQSWTETFDIQHVITIEEAETYVKHVVDVFNMGLRPSEYPRQLVKIVSVDRYFRLYGYYDD